MCFLIVQQPASQHEPPSIARTLLGFGQRCILSSHTPTDSGNDGNHHDDNQVNTKRHTLKDGGSIPSEDRV